MIQKKPFKNRNHVVILSRRIRITTGQKPDPLRRIEGGRTFTPDEPIKPTRQCEPLFQINPPAGVERAESAGELPYQQVDEETPAMGLPGFNFLRAHDLL